MRQLLASTLSATCNLARADQGNRGKGRSPGYRLRLLKGLDAPVEIVDQERCKRSAAEPEQESEAKNELLLRSRRLNRNSRARDDTGIRHLKAFLRRRILVTRQIGLIESAVSIRFALQFMQSHHCLP